MKLYLRPGACSIGIHVLLEEIGKPYERELVNLREGAQFKPEFTAVNPKSKVPTLVRDDGTVLTEYPAIAFWLAQHQSPSEKLLPDDADELARALECIDYAVATHAHAGLLPHVPPANFAPNEADHEAVKARGEEIFEKGLAVVGQGAGRQGLPARRFLLRRQRAVLCLVLWAGAAGQDAAVERRRASRADEGPARRCSAVLQGRRAGLR